MSNSIEIAKKDIVWSYLAKIFSMTSGLMVLPFVLNKLTAEEVGLNYLMLTIGSMVSLLDFGFSPQFGRNITYAFSGVKELSKEGLDSQSNEMPNYRLVAMVIKSAQFIYRYMSLLVLMIMMTGGTYYIYRVTDGFNQVHNSLLLWIVYSLSVYFNIYFNYYSGLLTGRGMIYEFSVSTVLAKFCNVILTLVLIFLGWGLMSIVLANFISPFIQLYYSYRKFYNEELKNNLPKDISKEEIRETLKIIWYNAKRLGIVFVGAYIINKLGVFIVGLYLTLDVVGSYGLLTQLGSVLVTSSSVLFVSNMPKFSNYQIKHDKEGLRDLVSSTILMYWLCMVTGSIVLLIWGNDILRLIGSNTSLPSGAICLAYLIVIALENNHSNFSSIIAASNKIPFVKASLISGMFIVLFSFLSLEFTSLGLLGVILAQGLVQLVYNNWKWPKWVLDDLEMKPLNVLVRGFDYFTFRIKAYF